MEDLFFEVKVVSLITKNKNTYELSANIQHTPIPCPWIVFFSPSDLENLVGWVTFKLPNLPNQRVGYILL